MEPASIVHILSTKDYKKGFSSESEIEAIMKPFHEEVVRQVLLGNKVLLPFGMEVEVVKFRTKKKTPRIGFDYKMLFRSVELKKKNVKFLHASSFQQMLNVIITQTDIDYKIVSHGYK